MTRPLSTPRFTPRKKLSDLTVQDRVTIAGLRRDGASAQDLADRFGTTVQAVKMIYQREIFA